MKKGGGRLLFISDVSKLSFTVIILKPGFLKAWEAEWRRVDERKFGGRLPAGGACLLQGD